MSDFKKQVEEVYTKSLLKDIFGTKDWDVVESALTQEKMIKIMNEVASTGGKRQVDTPTLQALKKEIANKVRDEFGVYYPETGAITPPVPIGDIHTTSGPTQFPIDQNGVTTLYADNADVEVKERPRRIGDMILYKGKLTPIRALRALGVDV